MHNSNPELYLPPDVYDAALKEGYSEELEANNLWPIQPYREIEESAVDGQSATHVVIDELQQFADANNEATERVKDHYNRLGIAISDAQAKALSSWFESVGNNIRQAVAAVDQLNEVLKPEKPKPAWAKFNEAPKRRKR